MGVLLQRLDGLGDVAGVPELHPAVVPAAGQVVLLVGVEVQVPHQLAVCTLYAVDLAVRGRRGRARVRGGTREASDCTLHLLPDPVQRRSQAGHSCTQCTPATLQEGGRLAALKGVTWNLEDESDPEG